MGLFSDSKSTTTNYNDNRANVDNSVTDIGAGSTATVLGNVAAGDDSDIRIEVTDQGAVQGALATVDNSIDAIQQTATSTASEAIKAVQNSYQSDTKSISQDAIKWGGIVALGFVILKIWRG